MQDTPRMPAQNWLPFDPEPTPSESHNPRLIPHKVISGGQLGADQAGLWAARVWNVPTGGWMPRGFRTVNGPDPQFARDFGLCEHPSEHYPPRTAKNIHAGDATLRFAFDWNTPGERLTRSLLLNARKPFLDIDAGNPIAIAYVADRILTWNAHTLNIAGNVEPQSHAGAAFGIGAFTFRYCSQLLEALGHTRQYSVSIPVFPE